MSKTEPKCWPDGFQPPIMDEDDANREREERIVAWFENPWHILLSFLHNQHADPKVIASVRTMALALGYPLAAGAEGAAGLARKCGIKKQTINKTLNHFLAQLALEPLPFQRKPEARANMSKARKAQVKK